MYTGQLKKTSLQFLVCIFFLICSERKKQVQPREKEERKKVLKWL